MYGEIKFTFKAEKVGRQKQKPKKKNRVCNREAQNTRVLNG